MWDYCLLIRKVTLECETKQEKDVPIEQRNVAQDTSVACIQQGHGECLEK